MGLPETVRTEPPLSAAALSGTPVERTAARRVRACGFRINEKNILHERREKFMDRLFDKIYGEVLFYESDIAEMNKEAERMNEEHMMEFKDRMDEREREAVLELLDDAVLNARKEGFYTGMCYMFRGMLALLKG